jgi:kumamolisin
MAEPRVELPGSHRESVPGARVLGPVEPSERITVQVELKRKEELPDTAAGGRILTRQELAAKYGAAPEDIARVREFARSHGVQVVAENPAARMVELAGTAADMGRAFGVRLEHAQLGTTVFRQRVGPITLPHNVASSIVAVLGLDTRPQASPR